MALPRKKISGVYQISNTLTRKIYIGSAEDVNNRWSSHKKDLKRGTHTNNYLQKAWDKCDSKSFTFEILEVTPNSDKHFRLDREQYWMDQSRCYIRKYGYNLVRDAHSTLGYKRNMPAWNKGLKMKLQSKETCLKKSLAHLGVKRKPFTKQHRENISKSAKRRNR